MKDFFSRDIVIKVVSVLCAAALWLYVQNEVNPVKSKDFRDMKVAIVNENSLVDKGYLVSNTDYYITVTLEGRQRVLDSVDARDIKAQIDFSNITESGINVIPVQNVQYVGPYQDEIRVRDYSPTAFEVNVEKINLNTFGIDIETQGSPKKGYEVVSRSVKPNKIELKGPESLIENVAKVLVTVDITDIDRDMTVKKECKVLDRNGQEIIQLQTDLPLVDVEINIAKEVVLIPHIEGKPMSGFGQSFVRVNPDRVLVVGNQEQLDNISHVDLEPVSIEGLSTDLEQKIPITLPEGLKLVKGNDYTVLTVLIEPFVREVFDVPVKLINSNPDEFSKVEAKNKSISVELMGLAVNIHALEANDIRAMAILDGLPTGTHEVPVRFILPSNVYMAEDEYTIEVKVERKPAISVSPSPTSTPAQSPSPTPTPGGSTPGPSPSPTPGQTQSQTGDRTAGQTPGQGEQSQSGNTSGGDEDDQSDSTDTDEEDEE